MQTLPGGRAEALIDPVAIKLVLEGEGLADSAVRPDGLAGRAEERAATGQAVGGPLDNFDVLGQRRSDGGGRKHGAGHGAGFQNRLFCRLQPPKLLVEEEGQGLGQAPLQGPRIGIQHQTGLAAEQAAPVDPPVEQVLHEQRIAAAAAGQQGRQIGGDLGVVALDQAVMHGPAVQRLQRHDGGQPAAAQLQDGGERGGRIGQPAGAEEEDRRRAPPPHEAVDDVERRAVAQVQILQHQQQRVCRGHGLQGVEKLAQHALAGADALDPGGGRQAHGGQLRHPARCLADQGETDLGRQTAEHGQHVEQRHERLARAPQVDALAAADYQIGTARGGPGEKGVDQRRLAQPGLAGDEDQPALAGQGFGEAALQRPQLGIAAENRRCRSYVCRAGRCWGGRCRAGRCRTGGGPRFAGRLVGNRLVGNRLCGCRPGTVRAGGRPAGEGRTRGPAAAGDVAVEPAGLGLRLDPEQPQNSMPKGSNGLRAGKSPGQAGPAGF